MERVQQYCKILSEQLVKDSPYSHLIDKKFIENIINASPLHDIGKVGISDNILLKQGQLSEDEFEKIKKHTIIGYETLKEVHSKFGANSFIEMGMTMALCHHERFDGSGYPYHMKGEKIDIYARYMAIVDTYTAMASPRTYRNAFTPLQILGNYEDNIEKYDITLLLPLMKKIANSQIGTTVQLSDDTVWEVLMVNENKYSRPILKNNENQFLDLSKRTDLFIVKNV